MKKILFLLFLLCALCCSNVCAENSTRYDLPEFSVHMPDSYLTLTRSNVEEVVRNNTTTLDLGFMVDVFKYDNTLLIEGINMQTFDEIFIKCQENPGDKDWRILNGLDDSYADMVVNRVKDSFVEGGLKCHYSTVYRHPQIVFAVLELEASQFADRGYIIVYVTSARINNKIYTITVTGRCNTGERSERVANDLQYVVSSLDIKFGEGSGIPNFVLNDNTNRYRYIDPESGMSFLLPVGWIQREPSEDQIFFDAMFVSEKVDTMTIMYAFQDVWMANDEAQRYLLEQMGYSRNDINNALYSTDQIAAAMSVDSDDVYVMKFANQDFFVINLTEDSATTKAIMLVAYRNGYMYTYGFVSDKTSDTEMVFSIINEVMNSIVW